MGKIIRLLFIFLTFIGCSGDNVEEETEVSCNTASGLWTISSATCNGVASTRLGLVYLLFNENGTVAQTEGITECASTFTWEFLLGVTSPTLDLSGRGKLSCSSNGESTVSCTTTANSCNSQVDIAGIANNYSTCVIASGAMKFTRKVSAINNPDSLSYCDNGQDEIVTLTKATDINLTPPPDPATQQAALVIIGPNPVDFGTIAVGRDRTITLTVSNQGNSNATALTAGGLDAPYSFRGGTYPGVGGTCANFIVPKGSCTVSIEFSPTSVGTFSDVLQIGYHNGKTNLILNHGMLGKGSQSLGVLNISNGPFYDFGSVNLGASESHTFTVTNSGGGTATAMSAVALTAPFQYVGGSYPGSGGTCATALSAGANCTIVVEFSPIATGTPNSTIRLNYNDGSFPQFTTRNIFGTAIP